MLSCEQIPRLPQENLHNFRVARATENSAFGLRLLCPPFCLLPIVGPFFSRSFTIRFTTRDRRNLLTISSQFSVKLILRKISDTPCRRSPFAMNCSEVILPFAWAVSFPESIFPVGVPLSKGILSKKSWTVANPFLFLWVLAASLDRVSIPHLSPREH